MTIFGLILFIVIVGVLLGLINRYIPMPSVIKSLLTFVVVAILVIYVLQFFGIIRQLIPFPFIINL